jgi:hypothetical protein
MGKKVISTNTSCYGDSVLDSRSGGRLPSPVYLVLILRLSIRMLGYDSSVSATIIPSEEWHHLGCRPVYILCEPAFRRNVSSPSPEDGGDNVRQMKLEVGTGL